MAKPQQGAKRVRRRERKNITSGVVNVLATFNNTKVTFTDPRGNVISWSSAGVIGFKGSRKSTPFAAQNALSDAVAKAKESGIRKVEVKVPIPSWRRRSAASWAGCASTSS